jgi:hypothetical protein
MRKAELGRDPRRDRDRPVGPGRDHSVELERRREPLDRGLVFGRDEAATSGELEARRGGVTVADRRPDRVGAGSLEQAELRRPCA